MQPIRDNRGWVLPVPAGGLVLGTVLAEKLGLAVGDVVEIETLGGARRHFELPVAGLVETLLATPAYMDLGQLNRQLRDPRVFEYAALLTDPAREAELFAALKEMPGISAVMIKRQAIASMFETMGDTILIFISFFTVFAGAARAWPRARRRDPSAVGSRVRTHQVDADQGRPAAARQLVARA